LTNYLYFFSYSWFWYISQNNRNNEKEKFVYWHTILVNKDTHISINDQYTSKFFTLLLLVTDSLISRSVSQSVSRSVAQSVSQSFSQWVVSQSVGQAINWSAGQSVSHTVVSQSVRQSLVSQSVSQSINQFNFSFNMQTGWLQKWLLLKELVAMISRYGGIFRVKILKSWETIFSRPGVLICNQKVYHSANGNICVIFLFQVVLLTNNFF